MLDFKRLAKDRNLPLLEGGGHHHAREGWLQTHCPKCSGGGSGYHLGWNEQAGFFHCWRCGAMRFWETLSALLRIGEEDTRRVVAEYHVEPHRAFRPQIIRQRSLKAPRGSGPLLPIHRQYLINRGFDPDELIEQYEVQGTAGLSGGWSWRIVFPIHNRSGRIVAYQGRTVGSVEPKYRTTEDAQCLDDPRTLLYGIERVPGESVIIVEGATGVWRIGRGAVATLGIDWKREQANILRHFARRFILFDPEPLAQKRAVELAHTLSIFGGSTEILTGFPTDPGELTSQRVRRLRKILDATCD